MEYIILALSVFSLIIGWRLYRDGEFNDGMTWFAASVVISAMFIVVIIIKGN